MASVSGGLGAPYPNPGTGVVAVPYRVAEAGRARVVVLDVLGREVAVLADGAHAEGAHRAVLAAGSLAPGTYVVRLSAAGRTEARTLTVLR
ncbi:T9SS type A sorting domain-containing protein [Rubrivirga sp. IMCC45206]|uniref:T9SS type A sorting domain-containing protein n=1 Tax=Rubrivirga sp. IMCC45206 TaxID=3391614 RepID=UPI00398F938A